MPSAATIHAESVVGKALFSAIPASKATAGAGNVGSAGAGSSENSAPRFAEALKAARKPRDQVREQGGELPKQDAAAAESQKPAAEDQEAAARDVRRPKAKEDKQAVSRGKKGSRRADEDSTGPGSAENPEATGAQSNQPTDAVTKAPAKDASAKGVDQQATTTGDNAVGTLAMDASAVASQQIVAAAPAAAASDSPLPAEAVVAAASAGTDAKPAAPVDKAPRQEKRSDTQVVPKEEDAKDRGKPAVVKGDKQPAQEKEGDAEGNDNEGREAKVPHAQAVGKQVVKLVQSGKDSEPVDGAAKASALCQSGWAMIPTRKPCASRSRPMIAMPIGWIAPPPSACRMRAKINDSKLHATAHSALATVKIARQPR